MTTVGKRRLRAALLVVAVAVISLLHYHTPTTASWTHPLLQRAYYVRSWDIRYGVKLSTNQVGFLITKLCKPGCPGSIRFAHGHSLVVKARPS